MSDRDAAEALDALGKAGRRSATIHPSQDGLFDTDQGQEPQRKRVRRTKSSGTAASDRESSGHRDDGATHTSEDVQREREEYERNTLTPVGGHTWDIHHAPSGTSPHGHGGFDLPPLAQLDVLSNAHSHGHHHMGGRGFGYSGHGSRTRSPHDAPSHSHSPTGTTQGSLHLPPLSTHGHAHQYPPQSRLRAETHSPYAQQQQGQQQQQQAARSQTPTYADLAAHYNLLREERRRLEGLLAKTDDMMRGVKRGLEELRAAGAPPLSSSSGPGAAPQEALRLSSRERRERSVVWRVEEKEEKDMS